MKLINFPSAHLVELMRWFPDQRSCTNWSGPEFRHPFTEATFRENTRLQLPSFSLVNEEDELVGFGQYYLRAERCHLARLVIAPRHRGRRAGAVLIRELCQRGCSELKVNDCSLFVLESNTPAIRLYRRLGFHPVPYPEEPPEGGTTNGGPPEGGTTNLGPPAIEGCVYMIATAARILSG